MTLRFCVASVSISALLIVAPGVQEQLPQAPKLVKVVIRNAQGDSVGTATLSEAQPRGVKMMLDIRNLPPGRHDFHIHQKPLCEADADFNTAGLQYDPTGEFYGNAEHSAHSGPAAGSPGVLPQVKRVH